MKLETPNEDAVRRTFPEIKMIQDSSLADKVTLVWLEVGKRSDWKNLGEVLYTPTIKKSTIRHIRSTARGVVAVAKTLKELHGTEVNLDFLVAGVLLHFHNFKRFIIFNAGFRKTAAPNPNVHRSFPSSPFPR
jgi:hypothetical protein